MAGVSAVPLDRSKSFLLALGGVVALASPRPAFAESPSIALVAAVTSDEDASATLRLVNDVADVLEHHGVDAWSPQDVLRIFRERHSRRAEALSVSQLEQLLDEAKKALDFASDGNAASALSHLRRALEIGDKALETTNRDDRRAQQLFRACLLAVQVLSEDHRRDEALAQAIECRVRSPDLQLPANKMLFDPSVHTLLEEAAEAIAREKGVETIVDSRPQGCAVIVNGRHLGNTPYALFGTDQSRRVQVECDSSPARVHSLRRVETPTRIEIDPLFETAVREDGGSLSLRYETLAKALVRQHAKAIGAVVDVPHVLVVSRSHTDRFTLQRISRSGDPGASIFLSRGYTLEDLGAAVDQLISPFVAKKESLQLQPSSEPASALSSRLHSRRELSTAGKLAGFGTMAAGLALIGSGARAYRRQRELQQEYADTPQNTEGYIDNGADWFEARRPPYALFGLGAGVLVAGELGLALAADSEALPSWAAITSGVVGTALVTWSIVNLVGGGPCSSDNTGTEDTRICSERLDQRDLGFHLLMVGVAAFAPLSIKLIRVPSRQLSFVLEPRLAGGLFSVRGRM